MGGLGIDSVKHRNSALLAELIWDYLCEEQALWRKIAKSKYYPTLAKANHQ